MTARTKRKTRAALSSKRKPLPTTVIHDQSEDGVEHFVGIGNLRVMLSNDDGSWFAQGLEIDYAAQGSSVEDVQHRFENGLAATIGLHLKFHGNIEGLLRVAPPEVWAEFFGKRSRLNRYSMNLQSVHIGENWMLLPFAGIDYYKKAEVA